MNKICIGIIDEDISEINDIKRTIFANKPEAILEDSIEFKDYPLPNTPATLSEEMADAVIQDIVDNVIHSLVVDYRIIVESTCIEGTEIFKRISAIVPKFPIIILTNVPGDCYKPFVDADKVYSKREFFKLEEEYSQEKTSNIFRNVSNYKEQRAKLMTDLAGHLALLEEKGYSTEVYKDVISLEDELSNYIPQEKTLVTDALDLSDLSNAVDLLKEANKLLGDNDED